jgi:hypothetical protein
VARCGFTDRKGMRFRGDSRNAINTAAVIELFVSYELNMAEFRWTRYAMQYISSPLSVLADDAAAALLQCKLLQCKATILSPHRVLLRSEGHVIHL